MKRLVRSLASFVAAYLLVSLSPLTGSVAQAAGGTYWQVGSIGSYSGDEYASGVASFLSSYPLPQYEPTGAVVFVWSGATLGDGSFFQAGTTTNYGNCATNKMEEFAQAWLPNGQRQFAITLDCGLTISGYAEFSVYETKSVGTNKWEWDASGPSGQFPGSAFDVGSGTTGTHHAMSIAELSGSSIGSNSQLGPVQADPALMSRFTGGWFDANSAVAYYAYQASCPPTNVVASGVDWTSMGTGLNKTCTANGGTLW